MKYYVVLRANGLWQASQDTLWGAGHQFRIIVNAKSSTEAISKAKKSLKKKSAY